MIYSQLLREKKKKKRERHRNITQTQRERERERAWINWGAEEGGAKKSQGGSGRKLASKKRDKKQKSREWG
jgi:ATPase subunit of ABC transporter with duplicated ATPase domains